MERRTFLLGSFAATAALAVGADWYINAFDSTSEGTKQKHALLFTALLPVLLDGALPADEVERQQQIERTIENIHITMSLLPEHAQQKLMQLLELLETQFGTLLLTSSFTSFLELSPNGLQQLLTYWREHYLSMMNEAYLGLRELVMSSYYASPEHWGLLNYQKPALSGVKS
ncbi:TAT leader-containing periplasmic protein [Shewanella sp. 202IG2-18]|uniref:TAT leader-containing periplasmic protein n=1 Tax=Parashewanella hymeniacidonis TaxID=2807618 RepID=UPI0019621456|nr:TAT leader-containing periplasmic protein [Parashewanella hymeniacidonis]MBM7070829.1 TAT leader-containing periplasmic protein [Parashewanella hymeniacidonis]